MFQYASLFISNETKGEIVKYDYNRKKKNKNGFATFFRGAPKVEKHLKIKRERDVTNLFWLLPICCKKTQN